MNNTPKYNPITNYTAYFNDLSATTNSTPVTSTSPNDNYIDTTLDIPTQLLKSIKKLSVQHDTLKTHILSLNDTLQNSFTIPLHKKYFKLLNLATETYFDNSFELSRTRLIYQLFIGAIKPTKLPTSLIITELVNRPKSFRHSKLSRPYLSPAKLKRQNNKIMDTLNLVRTIKQAKYLVQQDKNMSIIESIPGFIDLQPQNLSLKLYITASYLQRDCLRSYIRKNKPSFSRLSKDIYRYDASIFNKVTATLNSIPRSNVFSITHCNSTASSITPLSDNTLCPSHINVPKTLSSFTNSLPCPSFANKKLFNRMNNIEHLFKIYHTAYKPPKCRGSYKMFIKSNRSCYFLLDKSTLTIHTNNDALKPFTFHSSAQYSNSSLLARFVTGIMKFTNLIKSHQKDKIFSTLFRHITVQDTILSNRKSALNNKQSKTYFRFSHLKRSYYIGIYQPCSIENCHFPPAFITRSHSKCPIHMKRYYQQQSASHSNISIRRFSPHSLPPKDSSKVIWSNRYGFAYTKSYTHSSRFKGSRSHKRVINFSMLQQDDEFFVDYNGSRIRSRFAVDKLRLTKKQQKRQARYWSSVVQTDPTRHRIYNTAIDFDEIFKLAPDISGSRIQLLKKKTMKTAHRVFHSQPVFFRPFT
jgi:hypothetical protein